MTLLWEHTLRSPREWFLVLATITVAFCSIIYELIFSQALTVIYGGTVMRYSVTIGLFLFSLGVGSSLFSLLSPRNHRRDFFLIEVLLSILGPAGLFFVFFLNSSSMLSMMPYWLLLTISHLPIIVVGLLSGLELPLLSSLFGQEKTQVFSEVLGFDYFGSLLGTLCFAIVLYPSEGLVASVLVIGLLNSAVALGFALAYVRKRLLMFTGLVLFLALGLSVLFHDRIQDTITKEFLEEQITMRYEATGLDVSNLSVQEHFNTKYQKVIMYTMDIPDADVYGEHCLNLGMHVQICEGWAESYHRGLTHVPLAFFEEDVKVLLLGGGDWMAHQELLSFPEVHIDHVDVDGEFYRYTMNHSFFSQFHDHAYRSQRISTYQADAYQFVRARQKEYDLIILDLPGIQSDQLLPLYSEEFYSNLNRLLKEDGIMATWAYPDEVFAKHDRVLRSTLHESGFSNILSYRAYQSFDNSSRPMEAYYLIAKNPIPLPSFTNSPYLLRYQEKYQNLTWEFLETNSRPNRLLQPNYDIIINKRRDG